MDDQSRYQGCDQSRRRAKTRLMRLVEGNAEVDKSSRILYLGRLGEGGLRVVVVVRENSDRERPEILGVGDVADVGQGVVEGGLDERIVPSRNRLVCT